MSWIIGRSAGSTQPSRGRVSLSLHSCQNPQFGMAINNIPLLEIKDFGPPARGGHFVLFYSFLPPQPYGTQFHSAHSSPVQLVFLPLPPRRWEGIKPPPRNQRFRFSRKGWTFCAFSLLFTPSAIRHAVSHGSFFAGSTSVPTPPPRRWKGI